MRAVVQRQDRLRRLSLMGLCLTPLSQIAGTEGAVCLPPGLRHRPSPPQLPHPAFFDITPLKQTAQEPTIAGKRALPGRARFHTASDRGSAFAWRLTWAGLLQQQAEALGR